MFRSLGFINAICSLESCIYDIGLNYNFTLGSHVIKLTFKLQVYRFRFHSGFRDYSWFRFHSGFRFHSRFKFHSAGLGFTLGLGFTPGLNFTPGLGLTPGLSFILQV